MKSVFGIVAGAKSFDERANTGQDANVSLDSIGWVLKSDKKGRELVSREYSVYLRLMEEGLNVSPNIDEDEGVFGYPDSILLEEVAYGTTLEEYCLAYLTGQIDGSTLSAIVTSASEVCNTFWDAGWVHGDLHARNLLVGYERKSGWRVYIIDFAYSFKEDEGSPDGERSVIETIEEDQDRLVECLRALDLDGSNSDYEHIISRVL